MTVGQEPCQADLFKGSAFVGERLAPESVFSVLEREGRRLFPDGMFDDLFSSRGRRSVPPRVAATVMVLQRVSVVGASALSGRVSSQDRGQVAVCEAAEHRGVAERPVEPLGAVQSGKGDGLGHLDLHAARSRGGCFNEPGAGAVSDGEELALGCVGRLRDPVQGTLGPLRVMSVVDHRMPRCRALVAGNLDWA